MLAMDKSAYVGIVISVGYELWCECGKPDHSFWFAQFLAESEENYTLVVIRCLQVLIAEKGEDWIANQGLLGVCEALIDVLGHWD
jgi:hypothetical protein